MRHPDRGAGGDVVVDHQIDRHRRPRPASRAGCCGYSPLDRPDRKILEPHARVEERRLVTGHHEAALPAAVNPRGQCHIAITARVANRVAKHFAARPLAPNRQGIAAKLKTPQTLPLAILRKQCFGLTKRRQDQRLTVP